MAEEQLKAEVQPKPEEKTVKRDIADNVVFIGKKPTMSYVLAVVTQFSDGSPEVHLKARGRSISRAVDVAEVVKTRFMKDIKRDVEIGTEEVKDDEGRTLKVSTIDIILKK